MCACVCGGPRLVLRIIPVYFSILFRKTDPLNQTQAYGYHSVLSQLPLENSCLCFLRLELWVALSGTQHL